MAIRKRVTARFGLAVRTGLLALVYGTALPATGADLLGLSAAPLAVELAAGSPALVVLWTPGCMACRKSLAEIDRFIMMAAQQGVVVRSMVPASALDDARALLARRGLTLPVVAADERLDAATLRMLLDTPLAYAVDRNGQIAAARGGLLGVWVLEGLAEAARGRE